MTIGQAIGLIIFVASSALAYWTSRTVSPVQPPKSQHHKTNHERDRS